MKDSEIASSPLKAIEEQEEDLHQSIDEKELVNQEGEFIIFSNEQEPSAEKEKNLDPNFEKLNYTNKINILLKALMMERNKNFENGTKIDILKREYVNKVKLVSQQNKENEELIEKVANAEIINDQQQGEMRIFKQKLIECKYKIDILDDKNKTLEGIMENSERSMSERMKEMDQRIEQRVNKIIGQKHEEMRGEKLMMLEKYKLYEKKIHMQKQQLKEAQQIIHKQRQMSTEERGESFKNTLDKLINSEKNLD